VEASGSDKHEKSIEATVAATGGAPYLRFRSREDLAGGRNLWFTCRGRRFMGAALRLPEAEGAQAVSIPPQMLDECSLVVGDTVRIEIRDDPRRAESLPPDVEEALKVAEADIASLAPKERSFVLKLIRESGSGPIRAQRIGVLVQACLKAAAKGAGDP
jgi:antitoxin component of MazEF toxin-antitoxin module